MNLLHEMIEAPRLVTGCAICGIPGYLVIGSMMFDGWGGFFDAVRLSLQPDWISALRGEWLEDHWQSLKLAIFILLCLGVICLLFRAAKLVF